MQKSKREVKEGMTAKYLMYYDVYVDVSVGGLLYPMLEAALKFNRSLSSHPPFAMGY